MVVHEIRLFYLIIVFLHLSYFAMIEYGWNHCDELHAPFNGVNLSACIQYSSFKISNVHVFMFLFIIL
jgi:hypothetical protein